LIVTLNFEVNEQKKQIRELQALLEEQQERVGKLKYELDRPFDDEYAIEIARDKLNYHLPGEIIFYNGRSD
jgi:cell division protein FtsB